jgi:hypothetical protein
LKGRRGRGRGTEFKERKKIQEKEREMGSCMIGEEKKNTLACKMDQTGRHSGGVSKGATVRICFFGLRACLD